MLLFLSMPQVIEQSLFLLLLRKRKRRVKNALVSFSRLGTKRHVVSLQRNISHILTQYTFAFALPSVAKQRSPWEEARNVLGSRSFFSPPPFAACGLLGKSSFLPRFPHIHTGTYAHEEKESHGIKTLFKATNRLCRYISYKYQKAF